MLEVQVGRFMVAVHHAAPATKFADGLVPVRTGWFSVIHHYARRAATMGVPFGHGDIDGIAAFCPV